MPKPVRMSALRKVFSHAHFEVARGSLQANVDYCTKHDKEAFEYGDRPSTKQGKRSDLLVLRDALKRKETDVDLLENDATVPAYFKYQKGISAARVAYDTAIARDDIKVALFFGAPGTGKSHTAREYLPSAYWKDNTKWWPGYSGQEDIIWDEFGGWSCTPSDFNKVFDKYPYQVEYKGGTTPLKGVNFIIISNFTPGTWWDTEKTRVDIRSIKRRIHRYCFFRKVGEDPIVFETAEEFDDFCIGK